jgi:hypothetical protein
VRGEVDRRALLAHLEATDPGEQVLIARFEHDDAVAESTEPRPDGSRARSARLLTRIAAAAAFLLALVYAH